MREIKFRVWYKKEKSMQYHPDLLSRAEGIFIFDWEEYDRGNYTEIAYYDSRSLVDDKNIFLMQYTGLKDLRKTEIYGGDIVTFRCQHCIKEHRGEVVYIDDLACFGIRGENQISPLLAPADPATGDESLGIIPLERVIGNIHQNPELMKNHD